MANISEDLASDDLNSLKFLLSQVLPREKLEKSKVSQHWNVDESLFHRKTHSQLMTEFPGRGHWAGEAGQGFVPERWPCGGVFSGHRQTRSDQKSICLQEIR